MKSLVTILLCLSFLHSYSTATLVFQNDLVMIMTDTADLFDLVRKNYEMSKNDYAGQVIDEVKCRLQNSENDTAYMDGMNLHIYQNKQRTSYIGGGLNYNEVVELIDKKKCKIYWLDTGNEIVKFKTKRKGSRFKRRVERHYIDKSNGKVFHKKLLYLRSVGTPVF